MLKGTECDFLFASLSICLTQSGEILGVGEALVDLTGSDCSTRPTSWGVPTGETSQSGPNVPTSLRTHAAGTASPAEATCCFLK